MHLNHPFLASVPPWRRPPPETRCQARPRDSSALLAERDDEAGCCRPGSEPDGEAAPDRRVEADKPELQAKIAAKIEEVGNELAARAVVLALALVSWTCKCSGSR